jgi:hypothetical protein
MSGGATLFSTPQVDDTGPAPPTGAGTVLSTIASISTVEVFVDGVGDGSTSRPAGSNINNGLNIGNALDGRLYGFQIYPSADGTVHTSMIATLQALLPAAAGRRPISRAYIIG